jgi:N-acetylneuraminic acid mutarotase
MASAHFLWITVEPGGAAHGGAKVHTFLNETPDPGGPEFLKFVKDVKPAVDGQPLPVSTAEETVDACWAGKLPNAIDAERDLGIRTKKGESYRLIYTARAQTESVAADVKETGDKLRARLITKDGRKLVQVLFDGKPVAKARLKVYPNEGDAKELTADEQGTAAIDGLAEGKAALWANWADGKAGEVAGKPFSETRYYATLTFQPRGESSASPATSFAMMPDPAVNSFGGAVLGDWLYVYSGHIGRRHVYNTETTLKKFRRLNLKDRKTWEELPMSKDVQGVALVSDGKFVYRIGGMTANNKPNDEHDLRSVVDFARFDPQTRTWIDLAPLPTPRSTHDAVVIGRQIYAVGGWNMKGATEEAEFLNNMVVFDLDSPDQGWKLIEQPFKRRALSAGEVGGKLYVLGGLSEKSKVERTVDVYDPSTSSWTTGPDLPGKGKTDCFGTSAFGVDGRLYFSDSGREGHIFRLDAQGNAWDLIGAWAQPRITHRLLPGPGHTLLAVGGNTKGKQNPVIEAIALPAFEFAKKVASGR